MKNAPLRLFPQWASVTYKKNEYQQNIAGNEGGKGSEEQKGL